VTFYLANVLAEALCQLNATQRNSNQRKMIWIRVVLENFVSNSPKRAIDRFGIHDGNCV
jgi:hypothetical protein